MCTVALKSPPPAPTALRPKRVSKALKGKAIRASTTVNFRIMDKMVEPKRDEATLYLIKVRDHRDELVFRKLYRSLAPKLLGHLQKRGMTRDAAEEVLQETFVTIWQKAHQFDPARANAAAWIFQIARNKMIDRFRGDKRPLPADIEILTETQDPDAEDILSLQDDIAELQTALSQMNADQRDIIEKAFLGEMSHSEIQELTGLPLGTIKSRIRLGLEKLRYELSRT